MSEFSIGKHRVRGQREGRTKWVSCPMDSTGEFAVQVTHLSNDAIEVMAVTSKTKKYNPKDKSTEIALDRQTLASKLVKAAVLNWRGLTIRTVQSMIVLKDIDDQVLDNPIDFTESNCVELIVGCAEFDAWLTATVRDPSTFINPDEESVERVQQGN